MPESHLESSWDLTPMTTKNYAVNYYEIKFWPSLREWVVLENWAYDDGRSAGYALLTSGSWNECIDYMKELGW